MALKVPSFEYFLSNYRWVFICFYLLPVSVFCDVCLLVKNWLTFTFCRSLDHNTKTKYIQKQVQQWIKSGQKVPLCAAQPGNHFSGEGAMYRNAQCAMYNVQMDLSDILEINSHKKLVKVQPYVTMGQLTTALLPLGWTIPVIPGIDDLTVSSLVLGTGLDSSSHKYGFFHNTCISYELVLCDGSLVVCSEDENPDLFHAVPWSHGTLGLLTAVKIRLIPARNFVKLEFRAFHNEETAVRSFLRECANYNNDFVEGLLYSENQCIVIIGKMVDQIQKEQLNEIGKWYKPWFFQHVKNYFVKGFGVEYIPLKDYYYRHTRSTYWEVQDLIPFGNNIFFRLLLGWAVPPNLSLFKLTSSEFMRKLYEDQQLMLDIMIPKDKLMLAIDTVDKKLGVYPMWLCPVQLNNSPGFVHSRQSLELYINAGIYGIPKSFEYNPENSLKEIEEFVKEVNGFKMLYGGTFMSEEEFKEQYDHTLYNSVREKLNCHKAFPTIFQKISSYRNPSPPEKALKDCSE